MILVEKIIQASGCSKEGFERHFQSFNEVCEKYSINTPERISGFLSNAIHETRGFRVFEEGLSYSDPVRLVKLFRRFDTDKDRVIDAEEVEFAKGFLRNPEKLANFIYSGRYGNEADGDGWKYRGRGIFQTTFKDNYKLVAAALKIDCVEHPELLIQPPYAMQSAGFYWHTHKLNKVADQKDNIGLCEAINGGTNGLSERTELFHKIIEVLS